MTLRERIIHSGIGFGELSKQLGISRFTLRNYCNGKYTPKLQIAFKMCDILNCSLEELVNG